MKRTPLKRKSKLKPRSTKLAGRMTQLKADYAAVFATNPACVFCNMTGATTPHHHTERRRLGAGLFHWIPVHEVPCHLNIHSKYQMKSRQMGVLDVPWHLRELKEHPLLIERNRARGV